MQTLGRVIALQALDQLAIEVQRPRRRRPRSRAQQFLRHRAAAGPLSSRRASSGSWMRKSRRRARPTRRTAARADAGAGRAPWPISACCGSRPGLRLDAERRAARRRAPAAGLEPAFVKPQHVAVLAHLRMLGTSPSTSAKSVNLAASSSNSSLNARPIRWHAARRPAARRPSRPWPRSNRHRSACD